MEAGYQLRISFKILRSMGLSQLAFNNKTGSFIPVEAPVTIAPKQEHDTRWYTTTRDGGRFCPHLSSFITQAHYICKSLIEVLRPLHIAIFVMLFATVIPSQAAIADESLEQRVKAAFLYKFGGYVEWPATAFASPDTPFTLCVLGSDPNFNATLEKMVQKENVQGRPVTVRQLQSPKDEAGCHILYIGVPDPQYSSEVIETVRGKSVLTVSESASQGIIGFLIANNRVRFNINDQEAAENGLVISSKLLDLAVNVTRRESMGEP